MTKHSRHERAKRAEQTERVREVEAAWFASLPADVSKAFVRDVEAARARGPVAPPPDMAPGTAPRPPRPGREPKPPKEDQRSRRGSSR
jgi:hypothetical protein